jgi:Flp pilus assembly pilin Flp
MMRRPTHLRLETRMIDALHRLLTDEEGQDLVEYILITAFIAVVSWVAIQTTGLSVSGLWDVVEVAMEDVVTLM